MCARIQSTGTRAPTPLSAAVSAAATREQRPLHRRLRRQGGHRGGLLFRVQALRAQGHGRRVRREGKSGVLGARLHPPAQGGHIRLRQRPLTSVSRLRCGHFRVP